MDKLKGYYELMTTNNLLAKDGKFVDDVIAELNSYLLTNREVVLLPLHDYSKIVLSSSPSTALYWQVFDSVRRMVHNIIEEGSLDGVRIYYKPNKIGSTWGIYETFDDWELVTVKDRYSIDRVIRTFKGWMEMLSRGENLKDYDLHALGWYKKVVKMLMEKMDKIFGISS